LQIEQLMQAIATLKSQRENLGDAVVDASIASLQKQLAEISGQVESQPHQRKLATILYTDVVDSTRLGEGLEPDEVLEVMDGALKRLSKSVMKFGGRVTRFQGDGFKAVFGIPVAQENDAEKAVRAGLEILETAEQIALDLESNQSLTGFQVRIGINTGMVAVGGETEAEDTVMGRAVNLAARMESAAPPGGLLISHNTYRHVRGVFDLEQSEPVQAKGFPQPVAAYLVKRAKPRAFRVTNRGVEGIETSLIGRETELKYLQDALLTAIEVGEGQVMTFVGDPGVGKSRLLEEFHTWIDLLPQRVLLYQGRSLLETQHIPYGLLRDLFAFRFQIQDSDAPQDVRRKFEIGFSEAFSRKPLTKINRSTYQVPDRNYSPLFSNNQLSEIEIQAHIVGQLLGFDFRDSPHLQSLLHDAQAMRNRGQLHLSEYFKAASSDAPLILFLEDIHWADDSSLDLVNHLVRSISNLPIVVVCTTRHRLFERRPLWAEGQKYHRRIDLQPLSKRESRQLLAEILQRLENVPTKLDELVVNVAEGNPFYIEELVKVLVDQGVIVKAKTSPFESERWQVVADRLDQVVLPDTLTGVLQARLDSLSDLEQVALQQAAVVGRVFWDKVVEHIQVHTGNNKNNNKLHQIFQDLRTKELIFQREDSLIAGAKEYTFKHDLLREVTYQTVLMKTRRTYHSLVADWLQVSNVDRQDEFANHIASHLEHAGRNELARQYYYRAGMHALVTYANCEAESFFQKVLESGAAGKERGFTLSNLGRALARLGYGERALLVWREGIAQFHTDNDLEGVAGIYTLALRSISMHNPHGGMLLCQEASPLLEKLDDTIGKAHLLHQLGRTHVFNDLMEKAWAYCQQAFSLGEKLADNEVQADTLATIGVLSLGKLELHESMEALHKSAHLADLHQHPYISGRAHNNLANICFLHLGDFHKAMHHFTRSFELSRLRGDIEGEIGRLAKMGLTASFLGELDEGDDLLTLAESKLESIPDNVILNVEIQTWRCSWNLFKGEWETALANTQKRLSTLRSVNYYSMELLYVWQPYLPVLLELDYFVEVQDWKEAEDILSRTAEFSNEGIYAPLVPYGFMSLIETRKGRLEASHRWLALAKKENETLPSYSVECLINKAEVELLVAEKKWEKAIQKLKGLVSVFKDHDQKWEVARALLSWAEVYKIRSEIGDYELAQEMYQKSLEMFAQMGAEGYVKLINNRLQLLEAIKFAS
jgi:class 3 adenylate cyclase/tetratricopeptide (TPR) repeat protein